MTLGLDTAESAAALARDMAGLRKVVGMMQAAIEIALDAAIDKGWPVERMSIVNDGSRGVCMQLALEHERGRPHWPVFEVIATFEYDHPDGARVNVIERWLSRIEAPT